jgi:NADH:ubiquinone oxidoreductase subunit H
VSAALPIPVIQLLQVLTVALGAPGIMGVIAKVEARLQGRRGPRTIQSYFDLAKLFRKEALAPEQASWFFLAAPLIAVAAYLTIPLLIPVLTSYGLPLGYMGDILGGGFLLALASFVVATAALETGSPYAQLGSSRAKTFSAIGEPVVLFVVFTVALLTGTDLPYKMAATVRASAGQVIRPAHVLASVALFLVILLETGRIPVETHTGTNEFGMIAGRGTAPCAGARGGQGQRVHGRRGVHREVRHQADHPDARRPRFAAVERAAVPAGHLRAVGPAPRRGSSAASSRSWPAAWAAAATPRRRR